MRALAAGCALLAAGLMPAAAVAGDPAGFRGTLSIVHTYAIQPVPNADICGRNPPGAFWRVGTVFRWSLRPTG
jgi:hypothetical protein